MIFVFVCFRYELFLVLYLSIFSRIDLYWNDWNTRCWIENVTEQKFNSVLVKRRVALYTLATLELLFCSLLYRSRKGKYSRLLILQVFKGRRGVYSLYFRPINSQSSPWELKRDVFMIDSILHQPQVQLQYKFGSVYIIWKKVNPQPRGIWVVCV